MADQYLALVLSPITATIERARKVRELWAASFVFSRTMYQLLAHRPASTTLIAPAFRAQMKHAYGAGIYHDRCLLRLDNDAEIDVFAWLDSARQALAAELGTSAATIERLIKIDVLKASFNAGEIAATARGAGPARRANDAVPVHRLNRLLDNLELRPVYVPSETERNLTEVLDRKIQQLYELGYEDGTSVFLPMPNATIGRLPSIPEIGLRELRDHPDERVSEAYKTFVEKPFSERIEALTTLGGRSKDLMKKIDQLKEKGDLAEDFLEDTQLYNELFFALLKREFKPVDELKGTIRFCHKYYAVVQLDGDGLGKAITRISKDDEDGSRFNAFSENLLSYANQAVEKVIAYGGLPVYAGGDDLLFLAPVAMPMNDGATNVVSLCAKLDKLFRKEMKDDSLSLSGGIFVSYYKYPLGEAVKAAGRLEKSAKKFAVYRKADKPTDPKKEWKPHRKKQALALEVRKHSGQTFGTTFDMAAGSFALLDGMLNFKSALDEAFLTAAMHRLQSIPTLLADVARDDSLTAKERREAFRKHQFGKGGPKHEGEYLTAVLDYTHAVFKAYDDALPDDVVKAINQQRAKDENLALLKQGTGKQEEDYLCVDPLDFTLTQRVFAALRFKQFLIMPDHD